MAAEAHRGGGAGGVGSPRTADTQALGNVVHSRIQGFWDLESTCSAVLVRSCSGGLAALWSLDRGVHCKCICKNGGEASQHSPEKTPAVT